MLLVTDGVLQETRNRHANSRTERDISLSYMIFQDYPNCFNWFNGSYFCLVFSYLFILAESHWTTLFLGGYKYRTWAFRLGVPVWRRAKIPPP
jgi:hypothetical protein